MIRVGVQRALKRALRFDCETRVADDARLADERVGEQDGGSRVARVAGDPRAHSRDRVFERRAEVEVPPGAPASEVAASRRAVVFLAHPETAATMPTAAASLNQPFK